MSERLITPTNVTYAARLHGVENASCYMGNGRREIEPVEAKVTVYPNGDRYVMLRGPRITRDGRRGRYTEVGWSIGGRWDQSDSAPPIVHELIDALLATFGATATAPPNGHKGEGE